MARVTDGAWLAARGAALRDAVRGGGLRGGCDYSHWSCCCYSEPPAPLAAASSSYSSSVYSGTIFSPVSR